MVFIYQVTWFSICFLCSFTIIHGAISRPGEGKSPGQVISHGDSVGSSLLGSQASTSKKQSPNTPVQDNPQYTRNSELSHGTSQGTFQARSEKPGTPHTVTSQGKARDHAPTQQSFHTGGISGNTHNQRQDGHQSVQSPHNSRHPGPMSPARQVHSSSPQDHPNKFGQHFRTSNKHGPMHMSKHKGNGNTGFQTRQMTQNNSSHASSHRGNKNAQVHALTGRASASKTLVAGTHQGGAHSPNPSQLMSGLWPRHKNTHGGPGSQRTNMHRPQTLVKSDHLMKTNDQVDQNKQNSKKNHNVKTVYAGVSDKQRQHPDNFHRSGQRQRPETGQGPKGTGHPPQTQPAHGKQRQMHPFGQGGHEIKSSASPTAQTNSHGSKTMHEMQGGHGKRNTAFSQANSHGSQTMHEMKGGHGIRNTASSQANSHGPQTMHETKGGHGIRNTASSQPNSHGSQTMHVKKGGHGIRNTASSQPNSHGSQTMHEMQGGHGIRNTVSSQTNSHGSQTIHEMQGGHGLRNSPSSQANSRGSQAMHAMQAGHELGNTASSKANSHSSQTMHTMQGKVHSPSATGEPLQSGWTRHGNTQHNSDASHSKSTHQSSTGRQSVMNTHHQQSQMWQSIQTSNNGHNTVNLLDQHAPAGHSEHNNVNLLDRHIPTEHSKPHADEMLQHAARIFNTVAHPNDQHPPANHILRNSPSQHGNSNQQHHQGGHFDPHREHQKNKHPKGGTREKKLSLVANLLLSADSKKKKSKTSNYVENKVAGTYLSHKSAVDPFKNFILAKKRGSSKIHAEKPTKQPTSQVQTRKHHPQNFNQNLDPFGHLLNTRKKPAASSVQVPTQKPQQIPKVDSKFSFMKRLHGKPSRIGGQPGFDWSKGKKISKNTTKTRRPLQRKTSVGSNLLVKLPRLPAKVITRTIGVRYNKPIPPPPGSHGGPGVTHRPILTATMLGQDMKNTTDIPEELEINGTSYDSPHDMNGRPHPLSPGYNQQLNPPPPPPPPGGPPPPNGMRPPPNTVTQRPILTATMLGRDMKNTTDIPEEIEINGTSYDSPHDMNGQPHPLDPGFRAPVRQGSTGGGGAAKEELEPGEVGRNTRINFAANPTPPPLFFNDLAGMTTVDYFGSNAIPGPPPPQQSRRLVPAKSRSQILPSTSLPTYRTVPATYAPPKPVYTVPPTFAAPPPQDYHQGPSVVPQTYAPKDGVSNKQIASAIDAALGNTKRNKGLSSKFANTIDQALKGKVQSAVDKALTSQMLETLDSIISSKIDSLLSGLKPQSKPQRKRNNLSSSSSSGKTMFGLSIEEKPFSHKSAIGKRSEQNSQRTSQNIRSVTARRTSPVNQPSSPQRTRNRIFGGK